MLENSNNTVEKMMNDVGVVVKDHFSRLIFKMNQENKCVQSTIDYIKNMPIVLKLQEELRLAREEISQLRAQIENNNLEPIKLKMHEINKTEKETSYDEISQLVSDKVNEKEKSSPNDFLSMYLNNQESDDEDDDDDEEVVVSNEQKTPIEMPYKHFLGLPKLDLDGAECSNEDEQEELTEEVTNDEDEDEDEDDEDEDDEDESEEELEVDELEINGKLYFTTDDKNGILYSVDEDGDIGDEIGYLKNGKAFFS